MKPGGFVNLSLKVSTSDAAVQIFFSQIIYHTICLPKNSPVLSPVPTCIFRSNYATTGNRGEQQVAYPHLLLLWPKANLFQLQIDIRLILNN
jgi:hypothetical protein